MDLRGELAVGVSSGGGGDDDGGCRGSGREGGGESRHGCQLRLAGAWYTTHLRLIY